MTLVEALGRCRHAGYGVAAARYDGVGAALLWTLEQGLGPSWTQDARAAWTAAYVLLAGVMRRAALSASTLGAELPAGLEPYRSQQNHRR